MVNNHFVSIIIPALNAEKYIRRCLYSLVNLNYSKDNMEIILVDNGSTDMTTSIAGEFKVKILRKGRITISSLRNLGAAHARGDILAFIDVDCVAPPNWVKDALNILDRNTAAVGAKYRLPENPSWVEKIWDLATKQWKDGEAEWLPGSNLVLAKKCFKKAGGFKEDLITSEDVEFCKRLRKTGFKIIANDILAVTHLGNPKTIREFFLKELWRGRGVFQNFLYTLPKIELTKARAFALFMLICIFGSIIGLVNGIINNGWSIFFIFISGEILSSFVLSTKILFKDHKRKYVFHLAFLYLVFGVARALCVLDYRNWKRLKRCPPIPVLLYHDIRPDNFDLASVKAELIPYILKKSDFINQIEWLADEPRTTNREPRCKIVFDDGWRSNYKTVYPILKKVGLTATFFVTIENIGKAEMMTWDELMEMADNGMVIGSHNMTHRSPVELSNEEIEYEIEESKRILEEKLGRKVEVFSSPTGFYDKRVINLARKAGYREVYFSKVAMTAVDAGNPIVINKIGIKRDCDLETFKRIVHGDKRILTRLRLKQIIRDIAKSLLGSRKYTQLRSSLLSRRFGLPRPVPVAASTRR